MKTTSLAIIAVVATALSASAASYTVTSPIVPGSFTDVTVAAGGNVANAGTFSMIVPAFDDSFGILQSVSYTLDTFSYGTGSLINTGNPNPQLFTYSWFIGALGLFSTPNTLDVPGTGVVNIPDAPVQAQGIVVAADTVLPFTTDVKPYSFPSAVAPNTAAFDGIGTVTFVFDPFVLGQVGGFGNLSTIPEVFAAARINVTYTYSDIPEASTYAAGAILLAGAGLVARRRLAAK
jgi:hypothetical protein